MAFNENTRVKITALLHLSRLGYKYISLNGAKRDEGTNIFRYIIQLPNAVWMSIQVFDQQNALAGFCVAYKPYFRRFHYCPLNPIHEAGENPEG